VADDVVGRQRVGEEKLIDGLAGPGDGQRRSSPVGTLWWRKVLVSASGRSSARRLAVRPSLLEEEVAPLAQGVVA
jgi:hypothetical protein